MKRRNDPTSAKVSNILGSYDKAKELVTSSHMIGAILQPATPCPSNEARPPLLTPMCRSSHKQPAAARNGVRLDVSRQGVFEQFQQSSAVDDHPKASDVIRQSTDQVDTVVSASSSSSSHSRCEKRLDSSRRSAHVANGRHKSSANKHNRPKLSIPSPKVSSQCVLLLVTR